MSLVGSTTVAGSSRSASREAEGPAEDAKVRSVRPVHIPDDADALLERLEPAA